MIVLHDYWRSSSSYRVRIALGLAGLEWTSVSVNLQDGEQRSKEHLERNPQGLVPVLEIDGRRMTQSLAIIEYLDETRGLRLLPKESAARARVRALAHAIAMEIHPVCNLGVAKFAVANSNGGLTTQSWMQHFISSGLLAFEAMLGEGAYCSGDSVGLADICLTPQVYNAHRWEVDLSKMPKVVAIASRLSQIDAFRNAHPDRASRGGFATKRSPK